MAEAAFFYTFTALMLAAAWSVIANRQPIHSVLSLLIVMFCLAALFIMLGAYFVAALQVLLYAGAVLVLFLFVIMLLHLEPEALARLRAFTLRAAGTAAALVLFIALLRLLKSSGREPPSLDFARDGALSGVEWAPLATVPPGPGTVEAIGKSLFTTYLLPFELTSFLILAAIIGAVTLAKQKSE